MQSTAAGSSTALTGRGDRLAGWRTSYAAMNARTTAAEKILRSMHQWKAKRVPGRTIARNRAASPVNGRRSRALLLRLIFGFAGRHRVRPGLKIRLWLRNDKI